MSRVRTSLGSIKDSDAPQLLNFWDQVALIAIVAGLSMSVVLGWFFDPSHPVDGLGWADQAYYTRVAQRIAAGETLQVFDLHFQIGYSLLGAAGRYLWPAHPYFPISFVLLQASAVLVYLAARAYLAIPAALILMLLLFYWDLSAGTFNYATDLFAVPWNNQVTFFVMCFFFWAFARKESRPPSVPFAALVGAVGGFAVVTREETLFFVVPLTLVYLVSSKAGRVSWAVCVGTEVLAYLPQVVMRLVVLDSIWATGHGESYGELREMYFSGRRLLENLAFVIFRAPEESAGRLSLLQGAPWLWLAPAGLLILLFSKKVSWGIKGWLIVSVAIAIFYLAGANMSAQKLKFRCIRYISPSFMAANLAVVVAGIEVTTRVVRVAQGRPKAAVPPA